MRFVTADEASIEAFLSVSADSQFQAELREYAAALLDQRYTKPEWCVVGLDADKAVARAALWSPPAYPAPTDVVLIAADWNGSAALPLMTSMHELAREQGAAALSHHVDEPPGPPQYQEDAEARIRLLVESGYEMLRDGLRWRYSDAEEATQEPSLVFRPLPDVGEDAFVTAIATTYEGTRDSWITQSIEEHGTLGAARADFADYGEMEHDPTGWELAYTADGDLAGVIMTARNPTSAVIAYVGVVPEQRGRGLAPQLVRHGTDRLLASGGSEIRGDCDRENIGMVKAFERAGYEQFARRRSYRRTF